MSRNSCIPGYNISFTCKLVLFNRQYAFPSHLKPNKRKFPSLLTSSNGTKRNFPHNCDHVKPCYLVFLILAHTFLNLSARHLGTEPTKVEMPAFTPLNDRNIAEAPRSQKHGKHNVSKSEPPTTGPSSDHEDHGGSMAEEEDGIYLEKHHHHHELSSVDKSITGGGVILGGLVMAFVVSIVCYIRATRRRSIVEPPTPTTARSVSP
ncbi:hypothetical protein HanPI659440_Chr06g0235671 [Helianthus annuus]|nr:hypothetical protein HanPI659440_Chr06g0235671 [Helianthus annuus]